jgi:hypothetical protein
MPLIDSALAFAITMLALSLTCSAFIELVHRAFKMREAGLKYMLEQMFDQVLVKYAKPLADKELGKIGSDAYKNVRESFVNAMTANRAPVGLAPDPALKAAPLKDTKGTDNAAANAAPKPASLLEKIWGILKDIWREPGTIWGGRSITSLTPVEFMERLAGTEVGKEIKAAAAAAGKDAADAEATTDAVLKDIALKFEAFGKDAATFFEGRARFLSVAVAIALAFAVHVDAIDLFKTYLQNPKATASVIAQSQAVTDQLKSMQAAVDASTKLAPATPDSSSDYAKTQAKELQNDVVAAVSDARKMVKQFTDLGAPFGWSDARIIASNMWVLVWTCKELEQGQEPSWLGTLWQSCKANDDGYKGPPRLQYRDVWFGIPKTLNVWFCLLLGGFLIGLGAPFWYDTVTGLANIGKVLGGGSGSDASAAAPDVAKAQPVTPAGAFNVSSAAHAAGEQAAKNAGNPATP